MYLTKYCEKNKIKNEVKGLGRGKNQYWITLPNRTSLLNISSSYLSM